MSFLNSDSLLDLLVKEQVLTGEQRQMVILHKGKQRQKLLKQAGGRRQGDENRTDRGFPDLVDIILSLGLEVSGSPGTPLSEEIIMRAVSHRLKIPFKKLDPLELDMDTVTKTIPRSFAINHLILPLELRNGVLDVVTYHPDNHHVLEDIERANQVKVRPFLSTRTDIRKILAEFFGFQRSITAAESQFGTTGTAATVDIGNLEQYVRLASTKELSSTDQHIKAAVNHLFSYALEQRASDIHIEPKRDICLVRFRIDGILHTIYKLPKAVHSAITSRIKSLARLDIAEKRRPQDGRIKIGRREEDREAEIRVSTVPVAFGEKTVMRILNPEVIFQQLDHLGFSRRDRVVYNSFMTAAHGIVLVTGPTGSGKSTTLYSTLKQIATPEKNIITVEDPVEMVYEEFNQIAVQSQIDVTFSTILRNILRQDPDIIMIGEIRDLETATHAVQAALTGHLVFSTLHTNDAVSTIIRLQDLGLEPFLIASTMLGALAQRLVRRICPHCAEPYTVDAAELRKLGFPVSGRETVELTRGKGCLQCRNTGYLGRMGIFEIFPMSEQLKKLIAARANDSDLRQVAIREGMTTLREDAWRKVQTGLTTVEEALRVTGEMEAV
ncbi:type II secretion system protein E [Desulfobulbus propionicus DSM 2032]|uniref:Type II secretion system protein E n=1 Tax=Desulfobulbus propionicus (strain ATCC 33891 / DSM 2032 / VKM B-1956 / 1pr3) TaxID=577650 RepID=A0A7U4DN94_DESPD|nr:GspE/PulE family protein [Desulfobulbus propionicus]ADW16822.1 type II secretion system protein E [Desulfobulbus propionicus DSM 2032]